MRWLSAIIDFVIWILENPDVRKWLIERLEQAVHWLIKMARAKQAKADAHAKEASQADASS